jgi:hypothetical protein
MLESEGEARNLTHHSYHGACIEYRKGDVALPGDWPLTRTMAPAEGRTHT